ncbi:hypothetical protein [Sphingomicrobium marinum]|uniref:hypothetical protein n=1 Tax=Sphingomicrobium marinum TaxID=1227950 RepID=UPI002240015C|nr:hypothetical protein [Sphingomicrobium marinum]
MWAAMTPKHDIPSGPRRRSGARRRNSSTVNAINAFTDKLVSKALVQMKALMDSDLLCVEDIEKFQQLLAASRRGSAQATARHELLRFVMELINRRDGRGGASPMPTPVFPRGNPPSLSGAAEAPLE